MARDADQTGKEEAQGHPEIALLSALALLATPSILCVIFTGNAPPGGGTSCHNFPALVPSGFSDTDCTVNTTCVITLGGTGQGNLPAGDYYGTCFTYQSATVEACACCEPTNVSPNLPTDQGPLYIALGLGICGGEWCEGTGVSGGVGGQSVYTELPECRPVGPTLSPTGPVP